MPCPSLESTGTNMVEFLAAICSTSGDMKVDRVSPSEGAIGVELVSLAAADIRTCNGGREYTGE